MALALSPFIVLLASGSRLIIIGNYDTTTATTMAASGGLGQTVLGTVIPLLPAFLPVALVVLAIFRQWGLLLFAAAATALLSPAYIGVEEGWHRAYHNFGLQPPMRGIGNGMLYGKTRASWSGVPYWVPDSCYGRVYFEAILIKWWGRQ
jgi:hypothetical protein